MATATKQETVAEIKEKLSAAKAVIMTDYRGLTVKEMQALRVKLREADSEIHVYKNTLTEIAVREMALPSMGELLSGPTAFVFGVDPVAPAKVIMDFAKEHKALEVKGGFVENRIVDANGVKAIASLPSREQLVAQLLGTMLNPMGNLVRVLNGPAAAMARVLNAIAEQKQAA